MKIALVSCVSKKQEGIHKARDLYISQWFTRAREYVEANYDRWFILSAKHMLLEPEKHIPAYELYLPKLPKEHKEYWGERVVHYLSVINSFEYRIDEIDIFAGNEYRKFIVPGLEQIGFTVNVPLKGLGIGKQLQWFKQR